MTGIDRPGGPGGPSGPGGPGGVDGPGEPDGAHEADATAASGTGAASGGDEVARLAAELQAGRIRPEEAIAQLVEGGLGDLDPVDQADLRALLGDLMAADPYLADLARSLGAPPPDGDVGIE